MGALYMVRSFKGRTRDFHSRKRGFDSPANHQAVLPRVDIVMESFMTALDFKTNITVTSGRFVQNHRARFSFNGIYTVDCFSSAIISLIGVMRA